MIFLARHWEVLHGYHLTIKATSSYSHVCSQLKTLAAARRY